MAKKLNLTIEACGCPAACGHCGSNSGPFPPMPLANIRRVLELGREVSEERGLTLSVYAGFEPLAHPQAAELLRLLAQYNQDKCNVFPTNGVAIANRDDWRDVLETVRETGGTHLWFTLHGIGEVHDRMVRPGAFHDLCLAVERGREMGLVCEGNLFVTKENIPQFDKLISECNPIKPERWIWVVANFTSTPRLRRYEAVRPELADLQPYADAIGSYTMHDQEKWSQLAQLTEAAYVQQALDSGEVDESAWQGFQFTDPYVICTSALALHQGSCGRGYYGPHLGSLNSDNARELMLQVVDADPISYEDIYFPGAALPSVRELAQTVANPQGQKLYFHAGNMRCRWLDLALNLHA